MTTSSAIAISKAAARPVSLGRSRSSRARGEVLARVVVALT
jgi:hypothetical protein